MYNTGFGSISFSSPPLVLNGGNNMINNQQVMGSGFNFNLPLATVAAFAQQGMNFQAASNVQAQNFLGNVIGSQNNLVNSAYSQNVALNNSAQSILGNYISTLGGIANFNAQTSRQTAQNSGGLFGGGGFLGLGF